MEGDLRLKARERTIQRSFQPIYVRSAGTLRRRRTGVFCKRLLGRHTLDPYQLVPLAKALALPRVNLLIADDVGAGKTIEAGLILRESLLRRRVDFVVVAAPPSMTRQRQEELQRVSV